MWLEALWCRMCPFYLDEILFLNIVAQFFLLKKMLKETDKYNGSSEIIEKYQNKCI